jgi:hypothetical protein
MSTKGTLNAAKGAFSVLTDTQNNFLTVAGGPPGHLAGGAAINQFSGAKNSPFGAAIGVGVLAGGLAMAPRLVGMGAKSFAQKAAPAGFKEYDKAVRAGLKETDEIFKKHAKTPLPLADLDTQLAAVKSKMGSEVSAAKATALSDPKADTAKLNKEFFDRLSAEKKNAQAMDMDRFFDSKGKAAAKMDKREIAHKQNRGMYEHYLDKAKVEDVNLYGFGESADEMGASFSDAGKIAGMAGAATLAIGGIARVADRGGQY